MKEDEEEEEEEEEEVGLLRSRSVGCFLGKTILLMERGQVSRFPAGRDLVHVVVGEYGAQAGTTPPATATLPLLLL